MLIHTATYCYILWHIVTHTLKRNPLVVQRWCQMLQCTAKHCVAPKQTASNNNTIQHIVTPLGKKKFLQIQGLCVFWWICMWMGAHTCAYVHFCGFCESKHIPCHISQQSTFSEGKIESCTQCIAWRIAPTSRCAYYISTKEIMPCN